MKVLSLYLLLVVSSAFAETAPDFSLPGTDGKTHKLSSYRGKIVVLEWLNHGCPFVKKHYGTGNMQKLQSDATKDGVVWFSIISSAKGKQGHSTIGEAKKAMAEHNSSATAVLLDEEGAVGRLYQAKTTPHMFVINAKGEIVYQGAIDDKPSTKKEDVKGATNYIKPALLVAKSGGKLENAVTAPYGCSVKY